MIADFLLRLSLDRNYVNASSHMVLNSFKSVSGGH